MDLLLQRDHSETAKTSLPSALMSSRRQNSCARNISAFIAATSRMTEFEEGRLQRVGILPSGATFRVEKCRDKKTGAVVAVKRLHEFKGLSNRLGNIDDSVLQEMKISVYPPILKHENITRTLGFESCAVDVGVSTLSLVTEFSDIGSLAQYIAATSSAAQLINLEQKKSFALDIASGLEALHRCWIIHGDVKPENILLFRRPYSTPESLLIAKLNDFGSSIVEDMIFVENIPRHRKLYRGTPIYVPPIVRESSGRVPFHAMPYCDVFSFGLVLWTLYKGRMYYESTWKNAGQTDLEYLDKIGITGLKGQFEKFLADFNSTVPSEDCKILESAFMACVDVELIYDDMNIPLIFRDRILKTAFGKISAVKGLLMTRQMEEDQQCNTGNTPFHLTISTLNKTEDIPWTMQCSLREDLINIINDPYLSSFRKGEAALQLSSCSSVGFGCKKSIEDAVEFLRSAATFRNISAQLIIHRVYSTHGKPSPILQPDKLPVSSLVDSEERISNSSDENMEELPILESEIDDEELHEFDDFSDHDASFHLEPQPSVNESEDSSYFSEADAIYAVFHLSAAMDREFWNSNSHSGDSYYCWTIRKFEQCISDTYLVFASFTIFDIEFSGLEDTTLLEKIGANWSSRIVELVAQVKIEDGSIWEVPLLHHAVYCGNKNLVVKLCELGADIGAVDNEGQTLLHIACHRGNRELAEYLIDKGVKASIADATGAFPLHWLWMFNDDDVEYIGGQLIRVAEANVNACMREEGRLFYISYSYEICGTALHAAVTVRNLKAVTVLLDLGADVNSQPFKNLDSPLEIAAQLHLPEIAAKLLACGANLREKFWGGWALHHVGVHIDPLRRWLLHGPRFMQAASDIIQTLTDAAKWQHIDLDLRRENESTAFEAALLERGEDSYIIKAFLMSNIKPTECSVMMAVLGYSDNEENASKLELIFETLEPASTILYDAFLLSVQIGAVAAAIVILSHGGQRLLHFRDEEQKTPLHWAAEAGRMSMLRLLVDEGADLDAVDLKGVPPVGYALSVGSIAMVKLLLNSGCSIWLNMGDWRNSTILNFGLSTDPPNSRSMLPFLLSADLDEHELRRFPLLHAKEVLDAANQGEGNTVLHRAASKGDYESVFSLTYAGADVNTKNNAGRTPLNEAERTLLAKESLSDRDEVAIFELEKVITYLRLR